MIFLRYIILICCCVTFLQGCILQHYQVKKKTSKTIRSNEIFNSAHSGFMVYDPGSGKQIMNINGNKFYTPASNTKLLTFYATKKILGDSIPSIAWCIHNDSLFFTGLGDPTFLHPDFPYQPVAEKLSEADKPLVYIPQTDVIRRFGPGWSWDDFPYYYSAEKSSFPIYGNMIWVNKQPGDSTVQIIPNVFEEQLIVRKDEKIRDSSFQIEREEFYNRFYFSYTYLPDSIEEVIPFNYTDELFVYLLSDTLNKPVFIKDFFPACYKKVEYSVHIDSILKPFLTYSDNFFGEQLLLLASWQLNNTLLSEITINYAEDIFFREFSDELQWVDGSGLSRYNQVTPAAMVNLLKIIYKEFSKDYLKNMLPTGGVSGTLKRSFIAEEPYVYAKTGSMSNVYNLSGFLITQSGKWLIFSFMNNHLQASFRELKTEMEKILWRIHETY